VWEKKGGEEGVHFSGQETGARKEGERSVMRQLKKGLLFKKGEEEREKKGREKKAHPWSEGGGGEEARYRVATIVLEAIWAKKKESSTIPLVGRATS